MKLTSKELQIVVDEIYKQVSEPLIAANKILLDNIVTEEDEYIRDKALYDQTKQQIRLLEETCSKLSKKYEKEDFNGFKFDYSPFYVGYYNEYIQFQKKKQVVLVEYPTKYMIEKEVILNGNRDIPTLIETVVNRFKN